MSRLQPVHHLRRGADVHGLQGLLSVVRYLTLSFASFTASVRRRSTFPRAMRLQARRHHPHHQPALLRLELLGDGIEHPHSSPPPVLELGVRTRVFALFRARSRRLTRAGVSPFRRRLRPPVLRRASPPAVATHFSSTSSRCFSVVGSSAASLNASGFSSIESTYARSGFASSAVASSDVAASFSTVPNLRTFPRNSSVDAACCSPFSLPQSSAP